MDQITIDDFKKLQIVIGKIVSSERIEWSDKLLKLEVDIGEKTITVLSGIYPQYKPEDISGKLVPVLVNLLPRKIRDLESQGMILAAESSGEISLLHPHKELIVGSTIL